MAIITRKKIENYLKRKKTMNNNQIKNFIMFYERLTKHMLRSFGKKANFIVNIDSQHKLRSVRFN